MEIFAGSSSVSDSKLNRPGLLGDCFFEVPLGWGMCKMGKCEEGLGAIQMGLSGYEAAGVLAGRPHPYLMQG